MVVVYSFKLIISTKNNLNEILQAINGFHTAGTQVELHS